MLHCIKNQLLFMANLLVKTSILKTGWGNGRKACEPPGFRRRPQSIQTKTLTKHSRSLHALPQKPSTKFTVTWFVINLTNSSREKKISSQHCSLLLLHTGTGEQWILGTRQWNNDGRWQVVVGMVWTGEGQMKLGLGWVVGAVWTSTKAHLFAASIFPSKKL